MFVNKMSGVNHGTLGFSCSCTLPTFNRRHANTESEVASVAGSTETKTSPRTWIWRIRFISSGWHTRISLHGKWTIYWACMQIQHKYTVHSMTLADSSLALIVSLKTTSSERGWCGFTEVRSVNMCECVMNLFKDARVRRKYVRTKWDQCMTMLFHHAYFV